MDLWIETDALEAVRKVYDEYLTVQYKNNPSERLHRLLGFGNSAPNQDDAKALKLAEEAYVRGIKAGGTDLEATNAAGDAMHGEFARERFIRLNADPNLYRTNVQYHQNLNEKAELAVKEDLNERSQKDRQLATADAPGPKSTLGLESTQEQSRHPQMAPQGAALNPGAELGPIIQSKQLHDDPKNVHGLKRPESEQHTQNAADICKRAEMHDAAKEILKRIDEAPRQTITAVEGQPTQSKKQEEKVDWDRYHSDPDYQRELKAQAKEKWLRQGEQQQRKSTLPRKLGR
jgi:hypothetical protein